MKLRNKQTGEIATLTLSTNGEDMIIMGNDMLAHITKLSELNDYEDYEEPKESKKYWFINSGGETVSYYEEDEEPEDTGACKEIGNYFETREEAEKAVGKLKAWKRLKDKGFDFEYVEGYKNLCGNGFEIPITATMLPEAYTDVEVSKDLDLLFCPEENI